MTIRIGEPAPRSTLQAYRRGEEDPVTVTLEDLRGDWLLVFERRADEPKSRAARHVLGHRDRFGYTVESLLVGPGARRLNSLLVGA